MGLKITCDICGKEDNECKKFILPVKGQEDIRNKGGCLLGRFPTTIPQEKYVCRDCASDLSVLADLISYRALGIIKDFKVDIIHHDKDNVNENK